MSSNAAVTEIISPEEAYFLQNQAFALRNPNNYFAIPPIIKNNIRKSDFKKCLVLGRLPSLVLFVQ